MNDIGYMGSDPGSVTCLAKKILLLLALSETVCIAQTEVLSKVVWEGARIRFLHPRDVLMRVLDVHDPILICVLCYSAQLSILCNPCAPLYYYNPILTVLLYYSLNQFVWAQYV